MIVQSDKKLMLDFVTVVENEAQLITEGLSAEEQATEDEAIKKNESWKVGKGYKAKSEREAAFPLHLLERGYSIDITKAEASRECDRKSILNCIAGACIDFIRRVCRLNACAFVEWVCRLNVCVFPRKEI